MPTCHSLLCLTLAAATALSIAGGFAEEPDPENVVGSALVGDWVQDDALTARLEGREVKPTTQVMSFRHDPDVAAQVPAMYAEFLEAKRIYMAGTMTWEGVECPFLLIEYRGNPHVLYFRERGGDAFGNGESFNVIIARGGKTGEDLLFMGGDFNNQSFKAYHRQTR